MPAGPGRPKGSKNNPFKAMLMSQLRDDAKDLGKLRDIANKAIEKALAGDMQAISFIADRIDGKPAQAVTGPDGGPVQMAVFDPAKLKDLNDDEFATLERAMELIGVAIGEPDSESAFA